MNISIRHIQHFIAVAQELHFRRAAQLTNVAQPALSRSVQTLESELGVQLLSRNNRNVMLTAAGKEFLAGCTEMVDIMETTISKSIRADQSQFGGINIGYTYIAMCGKLPQLISGFEQKNPSIDVETISASTTIQLEQLHRKELDCCFISGPVSPLGSAEIESIEFQSDAFIIIVNHNHPLADKGTMSIEELGREKILLASQPKDSTFNQHVYRFFDKAGITPNVEFVEQNHIGILGNVALERGVCIATEGYGCLYSEELSTLKLTGITDALPTIMVWRKDMQVESAIKFRDFIVNSIQRPNSTEQQRSNPATAYELS